MINLWDAARVVVARVLGAILLLTVAGWCQDREDSIKVPDIKFTEGPAEGHLSYLGRIDIPAGFVFAGKGEAAKVMELTENIPSGQEVGFLAPDSGGWFIVFEFDNVGYVKDDEKEELDADELFKAMQEGTNSGNKTRRERGWPTLELLGWVQTPRYNDSTHNLEWATRLRASDNQVSVNYNTRRLGRDGVMQITIAAAPEELADVLPQFHKIMASFSFKSGHTYAEYREGDKLADYGLKALVIGGGAAVAAKAGLFKWLWKIIVVALAAGGAFLKRLLGRDKETVRPSKPV